jgi:diacylglycerol kinase (ATP)
MINLRKLLKSFGYANQGLYYAFKENQNIKIHIVIGIIVLILGLFLGLTKYEMFSVALLVILVITAEMINTSIEEVVNLLIDEHNEHAKVAKDVGAGMVLLVSIFAVVVGTFIFLPHLLMLFS